MNKFYKHEEGYMVGVTKKGQEFLFDEEDWDVIQHFSWFSTTKGYINTSDRTFDVQLIPMHRMVLHAEDPKQHIDHINGNPSDNRKSNLRVCTQQQNLWNQPARTNNISGYKGVYPNKRRTRWKATIKVNYENIYLGQYDTKEQAALAYNQAAIKYHGEFAKLNEVV